MLQASRNPGLPQVGSQRRQGLDDFEWRQRLQCEENVTQSTAELESDAPSAAQSSRLPRPSPTRQTPSLCTFLGVCAEGDKDDEAWARNALDY